MKNFVFISPNFPDNYWHFCQELRCNGLRVLGIGDSPYDALAPELKGSLDEYYKVGSLENYDEVYRAVAYFIFRYGPIDWLESNNEYWLERDAKLRTAYHITSGFQECDMERVKYKSAMKPFYAQAGIPAARWHIVDDLPGCREFIAQVGYPVIVKPDNGVGASRTYKLHDDRQLEDFLAGDGADGTRYIMEEFVLAEVVSYDAVVNAAGKPLFEASNCTPSSLMDVVNNGDNSFFYIQKEVPEDLRTAGRATLKAFGVTSRFVHFEFFRLLADHEGLGEKGGVVALEVNMRPSGGVSPDLMNYAGSTDVYKIWADMIAFDTSTKPVGERSYCAFLGRRDGKDFVLDDDAFQEKYAASLKQVGRVPDVLSGAMGNRMFVATFPTREELERFRAEGVLCR